VARRPGDGLAAPRPLMWRREEARRGTTFGRATNGPRACSRCDEPGNDRAIAVLSKS
jgi:hypothetical protein